jgi:hypothetical protein
VSLSNVYQLESLSNADEREEKEEVLWGAEEIKERSER